MKCSNCGKEIKKNSNFCGKCGNELFLKKRNELSDKIVVYGFGISFVCVVAINIISLLKINLSVFYNALLGVVFALSFFITLIVLLFSHSDEKRIGQKQMLYSAIFGAIAFGLGMTVSSIKSIIPYTMYHATVDVMIYLIVLGLIFLVIGGIRELYFKMINGNKKE